MEDPEDIPAEFEPHFSATDLTNRELWLVSRYTPGEGYDEVVIEGDALRALVEQFANVLDSLHLRRGQRAKP